ncbi:class I SAM-dependent methyltransferase [Serratia marcescens]|uniref:class I SAM-dependent DNA methyltransferase n=1 Tax=Serratia TaxID=613 RepID=UPI00156EFA3F|nr:class I SAM-dependent methyltransferase [Serratia marcescens]NSL13346.1 class I SAM-dependent methyltransferase [Serratia marcescens]
MTEKLASTIIPLYDEYAATWERLRPTTLFERPWLDRFLRLTAANARLLDLGCGNGVPIAAYFIEQGHRVTGIDGAQAMIARCRQRFPQQEWRQMDMRQLDLAAKFDGLLAWDSFFHLARDDQRRMFPLFRRHAGQHAALMFTSGPADGVAIGSFEGQALFHASLAPEEYRHLLQENGFRVVDHVVEDPTCGGRTVWLAQVIE